MQTKNKSDLNIYIVVISCRFGAESLYHCFHSTDIFHLSEMESLTSGIVTSELKHIDWHF